MKLHHALVGSVLLSAVALATGCAGAKIKDVRTDLQPNAIAKTETIFVKDVNADKTIFTGDKAGDEARVNEEKNRIRGTMAGDIVMYLNKHGFKARTYTGAKDDKGIILESVVTKFAHGSAAARMFVGGIGGGSSDMHIAVKLVKSGGVLADFDVIATSGGRGGVSSMGSFLDAHMEDGAQKIAEYLADKTKSL